MAEWSTNEPILPLWLGAMGKTEQSVDDPRVWTFTPAKSTLVTEISYEGAFKLAAYAMAYKQAERAIKRRQQRAKSYRLRAEQVSRRHLRLLSRWPRRDWSARNNRLDQLFYIERALRGLAEEIDART